MVFEDLLQDALDAFNSNELREEEEEFADEEEEEIVQAMEMKDDPGKAPVKEPPTIKEPEPENGAERRDVVSVDQTIRTDNDGQSCYNK